MWVGIYRLQDQIWKSLRYNSSNEEEETRVCQTQFHNGHRSSSAGGHTKQEFRCASDNRINVQLDENRNANRFQPDPGEVLHRSYNVVDL